MTEAKRGRPSKSDKQAKEIEELIAHCISDSAEGLYIRSWSSKLMIPRLLLCVGCYDPLLITGETGTGKEMLAQIAARLCHMELVAINCAEFTSELVSSELFGHVQGGFTGAVKERAGILETLGNKILFLDELAEMSHEVQARLLRVIQQGEYRKVGEDSPKKLPHSLRLIAATNAEGKLREDLRWRFPNVIHVPALRDRITDMFFILEGILDSAKGGERGTEESERDGKNGGAVLPSKRMWAFTPASFCSMLFSDWPGNVRELGNAARASINSWDPEATLVPFHYGPPADCDSFYRVYVAFFANIEGRGLVPAALKGISNWVANDGLVRDSFWKTMRGLDILDFVGGDVPWITTVECLQIILSLVQSTPLWNERVKLGGRRECAAMLDFFDEHRMEILARACPIAFPEKERDVSESICDLTNFTEEELLRQYYTQLDAAHPGKSIKDKAEAAGISPDAFTRRARDYIRS